MSEGNWVSGQAQQVKQVTNQTVGPDSGLFRLFLIAFGIWFIVTGRVEAGLKQIFADPLDKPKKDEPPAAEEPPDDKPEDLPPGGS